MAEEKAKKKKGGLFSTIKGLFTGPSLEGLHSCALNPDAFSPSEICHYGMPDSPCCIAYDAATRLCAIGSSSAATIHVCGARGTEHRYAVPRDSGALRGIAFFGKEGSFAAVTESAVHLFRAASPVPFGTARIELRAESFDCAFGEEFLLVGNDTGDLIAVDLVRAAVSPVGVKFGKVVGREDAGRGPAMSVLRINPVCSACVLMYHGSPLKLLTAWDLANGKPMHRYLLREYGQVTCAAWHRKGDRFITAHEDGLVCLWKFKEEKKPVSVFPIVSVSQPGGTVPRPLKIDFSRWNKDDLVIALAGNVFTSPRECAVHVMCGPKESPAKLRRVEPIGRWAVDFCAMYPGPLSSQRKNPFSMLTLTTEGKLLVNSLTEFPFRGMTLNTTATVLSASPVTCMSVHKAIAFPPISSTLSDVLFTGHADGTVVVWDNSGGGLRFFAALHSPEPHPVTCLCFSQEKTRLAVAHRDRGFVITEWHTEPRAVDTVVFEVNSPEAVPAPATAEQQQQQQQQPAAPEPSKKEQPAGFQVVAEFPYVNPQSLVLGAATVAAPCGHAGLFWADPSSNMSFSILHTDGGKPATAVVILERQGSMPTVYEGKDDGTIIVTSGAQFSGAPASITKVSCKGGFVSRLFLLGEDAQPLRQPLAGDAKQRLFLLSCQALGVTLFEIVREQPFLKEVRSSSKGSRPAKFVSFGLATKDGSTFVVGVDQQLRSAAFSLMQCVELASIQLAAVPPAPMPSAVASSGECFFMSSPTTLSVVSVLSGATKQQLEMVPCEEEAVPAPKTSFLPSWNSLGLPVGHDLRSIFFLPVPGESHAPEAVPQPPRQTPQQMHDELVGKEQSSSDAQARQQRPKSPGVAKATADTQSTAATMNETRNLLLQNKERMEEMSERTGELAAHATEFSRLCHELAKQNR